MTSQTCEGIRTQGGPKKRKKRKKERKKKKAKY